MNDAIKALLKQAVTNKEARAMVIKLVSSEESKAKLKKVLTKKYKGTARDQWVDFKYWLKIWGASMSLTNPIF